MKFVHFADCHLDGYREEKLAKLGFEHFQFVIDFALEKHVDFVLLAGDLFNTALPRIDTLKETVIQLKKLQDAQIPIYAIPGSHDFSPHGKTMFDVLEKAGLLNNVMKGKINMQGCLELEFTIDKKTNTHLAGIIGKKGMLDKQLYENLAPIRPVKGAPNIFLFHTSITELKPTNLELMQSVEVSILPAGFNYYAGGHVHVVKEFSSLSYQNVVYPGPTFPNNFAELEKLRKGSFIFYDDAQDFDGKCFKHVFIEKKEVLSFSIDVTNKSPLQVQEIILQVVKEKELNQKIILFRFAGKLAEGKPGDIDFKSVFQELYVKGAFIVLRNTYNMTAPLLKDIEIKDGTTEEIEAETISEHLNQILFPKELNEKEIINQLLKELSIEQMDGEKKTTFVEHMQKVAQNILEK
ncbi:exonuclease SbcCD subunit D [Candidatus Woesearchaeota archaeon]|nr:exonuclease SbcCD subunit D [Candidatus Woesearchaeota archaeon]